MAKSDSITVTYSVGDKSEVATVVATQNGRRVEQDRGKVDLEVIEITRGGTIVRRLWFPLSAVLCIDSQIKE